MRLDLLVSADTSSINCKYAMFQHIASVRINVKESEKTCIQDTTVKDAR